MDSQCSIEPMLSPQNQSFPAISFTSICSEKSLSAFVADDKARNSANGRCEFCGVQGDVFRKKLRLELQRLVTQEERIPESCRSCSVVIDQTHSLIIKSKRTSVKFANAVACIATVRDAQLEMPGEEGTGVKDQPLQRKRCALGYPSEDFCFPNMPKEESHDLDKNEFEDNVEHSLKILENNLISTIDIDETSEMEYSKTNSARTCYPEVSTVQSNRFRCYFCHKELSDMSKLRNHLYTHTRETPFNCGSCSKAFSTLYYMKVHTVSQHGTAEEKEYLRLRKERRISLQLCYFCGGRYTSYYNLQIHLRKHTKEASAYKCQTCGKRVATKQSLNQHNARIHGTEEERKTLKLKTLITMLNKEPVRCYFCNKSWHYFGDLAGHMRVKHTKEVFPITCVKCKKNFLDEKCLKTHQRRKCFALPGFREKRRREYMTKNQLRVECYFCKKIYTTKPNLENHIRQHIMEGQNYSCTTCKRFFVAKRNLELHAISCSYPKTKPQNTYIPKQIDRKVCGNCGKSFRYLKQHAKICGKLKTVCIMCNANFKTVAEKDLHENKVHRGWKMFDCPLCPKEFLFRHILKRHLFRHSKQILGDTWNQKFASLFVQNALKRNKEDVPNKRRVIVEKLRYVCYFCEKRFSFLPALENHIRRHICEKPYKCEKCDMTFMTEHYYKTGHAALHKDGKTSRRLERQRSRRLGNIIEPVCYFCRKRLTWVTWRDIFGNILENSFNTNAYAVERSCARNLRWTCIFVLCMALPRKKRRSGFRDKLLGNLR